MSMVIHSADFMWQDLFFAANTSHISPEVFPMLKRNELATPFGAEHNMQEVLNVRVGHNFALSHDLAVSRLRRSGILIRLPTALPWANLWTRLTALGVMKMNGPFAVLYRKCPFFCHRHSAMERGYALPT